MTIAMVRVPAELASWFAFAGTAFIAPDIEKLRQMFHALPRRSVEWDALDQALGYDPDGLEREFVRLFLNPMGAPCPPWQSAQSAEPALMGESHDSALAWFRRSGFEPHSANEPADHAGLLLVFYGHLVASGASPERLALFRSQHLDWIRPFSYTVQAEARHPFFMLLADLVRRLLYQIP